MPPCKNDPSRYYRGSEPSPKGNGWCAHADPVSKRRKGADGVMWIVSVNSKNSKFWKRIRPKSSTRTSRGGGRVRGDNTASTSATANTGTSASGAANSDEPCLVLVHATWCGYCQRLLAPGGPWEKLKRAFPKLSVREIDESRDPDVVKQMAVASYPDIRLVKGDTIISKVAADESARSVSNLKSFVKKHTGLKPTQTSKD